MKVKSFKKEVEDYLHEDSFTNKINDFIKDKTVVNIQFLTKNHELYCFVTYTED